MPQPPIPFASLLGWAKDIGLGQVLVIGRDAEGAVKVGNSGGDLDSIVSLLDDARAAVTSKRVRQAPEACDPDRSTAVRQSDDKSPMSHG